MDLQIGWRDVIGEVSYGASLVLSDNQVVIDKYPNPSKNLGSYYEGAKLGDIWGFTTIGIAQSQEEMDAHLAKVDQSALGSGWTAGDIMYADLDGDGKVNTGENTAGKPGDRRIIGNSTPRYNFGLNLDAAWKGFDIKVFFQGTLKRDYAADGAVFWVLSVRVSGRLPASSSTRITGVRITRVHTTHVLTGVVAATSRLRPVICRMQLMVV